MEDERTRTQLTDLFKKTDNLKERMSATEVLVKSHEEMIKGINKTNQRLEKCHADAQAALFGSDKMGKRGLVKTVQFIERYITWATIAGVILWAIIENFDKVNKVLGE